MRPIPIASPLRPAGGNSVAINTNGESRLGWARAIFGPPCQIHSHLSEYARGFFEIYEAFSSFHHFGSQPILSNAHSRRIWDKFIKFPFSSHVCCRKPIEFPCRN